MATTRLSETYVIINVIQMEKNKALTYSSYLMIILAIVMIYLGAFFTPNILYPPIVTGIGFLVLAWLFHHLKA